MRYPGLALALLVACGPGSPGGPTVTGRMNEQPRPSGPDERSNEILLRDARANRTQVQHILVETAQQALALSLLERIRAGEPIEPLMSEFSKDPGSSDSGEAYEVKPDAELVFEFKRLGLRLDVGEAGIIKSQFGWHVMKRIE